MVTLMQIPRESRFEGGAFEDGNLWVDSRGSFHVLCHVYRWGRVTVRMPRGTCLEEASDEGYHKILKDFSITERAPTRAFSWLKAPIKTILRHYAKLALTPQ